MTARARNPEETYEDYRHHLVTEARELRQRLKGFWAYISITYKMVPKLDSQKNPVKDELGNYMKKMVADRKPPYTNPDRINRREHLRKRNKTMRDLVRFNFAASEAVWRKLAEESIISRMRKYV